MPGTWGSAVAAVVFLLVAILSGSPIVAAAVMLAVAVHGCVVTVAYGDRFIKKYGPDPGQIVSDEQCGQAVTFLWLWPIATWGAKEIIIFTLAGFLLFRVFDIIKPPPVRQLERIPGAWGGTARRCDGWYLCPDYLTNRLAAGLAWVIDISFPNTESYKGLIGFYR